MDLINLQRLSAIHLASKIWSKPEVKLMIKKLFVEKLGQEIEKQGQPDRKNFLVRGRRTEFRLRDPIEEKYYLNCESQALLNEYHVIIDSAKLYVDSLKVPLNVKIYLQDVVTQMGEKIYDWIVYVTVFLRLDWKFSEEIYWTPYGTVDESKIFKIWESNEEFPGKENAEELEKSNTMQTGTTLFHVSVCRERIPKDEIEPLHILACINAEEDFIKNNQDEMEQFLKLNYPKLNFKNYNNKIYNLMAFYLNLYIIDHPILENQLHYSDYVIAPDIMLQKCAIACFNKAVYYFWSELKKFGGEEFLVDVSKECLETLDGLNKSPNLNTDGDSIKKDRLAEISFFLISQIPIDKKIQFLQKNAVKFINAFLPLWPFNESISWIVDNFCSGLKIIDYENIFLHIQQLLNKNPKNQINLFYQIFQKIFLSLPKNLKGEIFKNSFLHQYFKSFDFKCFNFVLRIMDEEYRAKAVEEVRNRVLSIAQEGKIEELNQFMNEVLITEDERISYQECIMSKCIDKCLKQMYFRIADELLDYFSSNNDDRILLKNKINSLEIVKHFVTMHYRYDKAEKFLEWMFDNKEERDEFRNSLDADYFINERIFKQWEKLVSSVAKSNTDYRYDYFRFFFGSPEEIKSVELKNPEDFFKYREKCGNLFIEVFKDRRVRICDLLYGKNELTDLYMKWVCKDEEQRKSIDSSYRNDEERAFFWKLIQSLLSFVLAKPDIRRSSGVTTFLYKNPFV